MKRLVFQAQIGRRGFARPAILFQIVGNRLAIRQAAEARALDGRNMDEDIAAAIAGLNEAKALGRIEPFHDTGTRAHGLARRTRRTPRTVEVPRARRAWTRRTA